MPPIFGGKSFVTRTCVTVAREHARRFVSAHSPLEPERRNESMAVQESHGSDLGRVHDHGLVRTPRSRRWLCLHLVVAQQERYDAVRARRGPLEAALVATDRQWMIHSSCPLRQACNLAVSSFEIG